MTIENLTSILEGELIQKGKNNTFKNVKIDSKIVEKGDLFFALMGKKLDGHDYIPEAIRRGASILVTEKPIKARKQSIIRVKNTLESLHKLASYYRSKYPVPLIAVTGSAGKTTTKELISTVLEPYYHILKNEKSFNNHIGVPLTLLKLNDTYDVAVIELGMNHAGELSNLSKLCQPDLAVITNIGTSHIGELGSKKNILKAKLEILDGMKEHGILILNDDDKYLHAIKENNKQFIYRVGTNKTADLQVACTEEGFCFQVGDQTYEVSLPEPYLLENYIIALQIGLLFGLTADQIVETLETFKMKDSRMERISIKNNLIIDDSYNASFESFEAALSSFDLKNPYLFILGDMAELGKFHKKYHKQLGKLFQKFPNKKLLLVGEDVKYIQKKNKKDSLFFSSNQEMMDYLQEYPFSNETIFIKGSHRMNLHQIRVFLEKQLGN